VLTFSRGLVLWLTFFAICLGLGYASLNRFDPRRLEGTGDTADYAAMVEGPIPGNSGSHRSYRVLVPMVARPIAALAKGRVGSWNHVFVGLLVSTALFTATAMLLIVLQTERLGHTAVAGLVAAFSFATSFWVTNHYLVGMVDSSEACAIVLMYFALTSGRTWLLPLAGVIGGLGKETFVLLGTVAAVTYWGVEALRSRLQWRTFAAIGTMSIAGLAAIAAVRWIAARGVDVSLVQFTVAPPNGSLLRRVWDGVSNAQFWYGLFWLLPLGLFSLGAISKPFVAASLVSAVAALLLVASVYAEPGAGNLGRIVFTYVGPLLSITAALTLTRLIAKSSEDRP
jgi:hypothetical protein